MKKNIVIVLLAICVIGLGGFLLYDKVLKEEKIVEKENEQDKNETEKTFDADLAYKKYIDNLINARNNLGKYDRISLFGESYRFSNTYLFEINKDGDLTFTFVDIDIDYEDYKIASKVVSAFLVEEGQDDCQTLYFITEDAVLYSFYIPDFVMNNKLDLRKEDMKNIVNVSSARFADEYTGGYGPVFVDIEGNVSH